MTWNVIYLIVSIANCTSYYISEGVSSSYNCVYRFDPKEYCVAILQVTVLPLKRDDFSLPPYPHY